MRRKKGRGMRTMERLTDLPNIGPKLAENLEKAGIEPRSACGSWGRRRHSFASALRRMPLPASTSWRLWRERRRASVRACCPRSGRQS